MGKRIVTISAQTLSFENVLQLVREGAMVRYYYDRDFLLIEEHKDRLFGVGSVKRIRITYMEHVADEAQGHWQAFQSQYFAVGDVEQAVRCYIDRAKSDKPFRANRNGMTWFVQEIDNKEANNA